MSVVAVDATVTGTIPTFSDTYSLVPSGLAKYISVSRESFSYNLVSPNSFRENTSKARFKSSPQVCASVSGVTIHARARAARRESAMAQFADSCLVAAAAERKSNNNIPCSVRSVPVGDTRINCAASQQCIAFFYYYRYCIHYKKIVRTVRLCRLASLANYTRRIQCIDGG